MLHKKMQAALNKQINAEFYSAYLYLSMSARFASLGLRGGAGWMHVQFQEETAHAMKFFDYVLERGGTVTLETIAKPQTEWPSALAMFEHTLQHEQTVTGLINDLADLALQLKDHGTHNVLQWFIAEQVEEEASAEEMIQKLRLTQDAPGGLFQLDNEMAARVFVPPATAQA
jgi:ferritin